MATMAAVYAEHGTPFGVVPDMASEFGDRLSAIIPDGNVSAFAKRCGISTTAMRNYLVGGLPAIDKAARIADEAGVSLDWLARGEGPRERVTGPGPTNVVPFGRPNGLTLVPRLEVEAAAGAGRVAISEEVVELVAFNDVWLRERGLNPKATKLMEARGDSNEPTIRDGDLLLVDTSITSVVDHAFYVIAYDGLVLVKRLTRRHDGSIIVSSDNEHYPPETIGPGEAPDLRIAGRVGFTGRRM